MGKWMPYITGGYANAAFSVKEIAKGVQQQSLSGSCAAQRLVHRRRRGNGPGARLTVGLEYRHYDFGEELYNPTRTEAGGVIGGGGLGFAVNSEVSLDTVTLRVNWKFGRPDRVVPLK